MKPTSRFLAPEVIQTSAMDCGPAALKCLLEGFGISASYGRLREACQTDVDGTSIDTIEDTAVKLGLEAEQTMLPADHLFIPEAHALPAIVVIRLPNGLTHFVVLWNRIGAFVQVMDPATGRRWTTARHLLDEVYIHTFPIPASDWRDWAGSDEFIGALKQRMKNLGVSEATAEAIIDKALANSGWHSIAALDASVRMVKSIASSGGLSRGNQSALLKSIFEKSQSEEPDKTQTIPDIYWSVRPVPSEKKLQLRGAVLLRVLGRRSPEDTSAPLSPELEAVLKEPPARPGIELFRFLKADGILAPVILIFALLVASAGIILQALVLRGFMDIGSGEKPFDNIIAIVIFFALLALLEIPIFAELMRFGRNVEVRLRKALLNKLPLITERYFHSRLISDMAERSHSIHAIRLLPTLGGRFIRYSFEMIMTAAGIIWLDSASAPLAVFITIFVIGLSFVTNPVLIERELRLRTHVGALCHFYFDAMLGIIAIKAHGAERIVRKEHEGLLAEWQNSGLRLYRSIAIIEGIQAFISFGLVAFLMFSYLKRTGETGNILFIYWALNLPVLGQEIGIIARQYPIHRNLTLRITEPLGAAEHQDEAPSTMIEECQSKLNNGVSISMSDVSVRVSGHTILEDVNINIDAGSHIAIVGQSGAGKSSLVGILLGWHRPAAGQVLIDDDPLDNNRLERLRCETAWIDPAVQIWNSSLLKNLCYGTEDRHSPPINEVISQAELISVLETLPDGMQTQLGEGGNLISGGEAQRVRIGRAMLRDKVRLVILDEAFRGLGHDKRKELLARARSLWKNATLICITHDVEETLSFDRVFVIDKGRIIEDGVPTKLCENPESRYRAFLDAEKDVQKVWSKEEWRRLRLQDGQIK